MLVKNKAMSLKVRSEPKVIQTFGKTKMKYLVPLKMKVALVASEEGNIFGISRIIAPTHSLISNEEQIVHILTDNELIIQNFTPNAAKLLCLDSTAINNNLEITEYIKEFTEELYKEIDKHEEIKENSYRIYKKIKIDLLNKMFSEKDIKKLVTWRWGDVVNSGENANYRNSKFGKIRNNFNKNSFVERRKNQSSFNDNVGRALKMQAKVNNKRNSVNDENMKIINTNANTNIETQERRIEFQKNQTVTFDDEEKQIDLKQLNPRLTNDSIYDNQATIDSIINKNESNKNLVKPQQIYHKFILSVSESKIGELKVGYIFKFELYTGQNFEDTSNFVSTKINTKSLIKPPTLKDGAEFEKSDISLVSFTPKIIKPEAQQVVFNATKENPKGINLGLNNTYIPFLNKENEFMIDVNKLSYKQKSKNENENEKKEIEAEKLRQKAIEKISKIKLKKDEESEEEEESSSDESSYEENESNENSEITSIKEKTEGKSELISQLDQLAEKDKSSPKIDMNITSKDKENQILEKLENHKQEKSHEHHGKHNKEDDYYHVDPSKITLFIYNYTTGFVQALKDPKYKISKVVDQLNKEKEKLSKMNSKFIANPKLAKEKKRANVSTKQIMDDDELDAYSKKKIKLKEIQKALASKEKQSSIINLCIFSFIVFILIVGSSVTSILINNYLKNQITIYYNLIEKSVTLYRNLIFEINFVREMILLAHPIYSNTYDKNKTEYYSNYSETCYEYYLETSFVLSNLSTAINSLSQENKEKIMGIKGELEIIDPLKTNNGDYFTKSYELLIYSAFHELNAALYHVSQMKIDEINSYEDNVYYFMRNSMNYMMVISEQQIDNFTDEFYNEIKNVHYILIICIAVMIVVYGINYLIFIHFYQKVEERKQSYLSVFYEIGSSFIVTSLAKCEKFSQKIQLQDDMMGAGERISIDSSSEESDMENDIGSVSSLSKIKEKKVSNAGKARNVKKNSNIAMKIGGFVVLFILLLVQIYSYYYYYTRISLYKHYVQYEYYNNKYNSRFLFPFIALREYLYDQKKILLMQEVDKYLDNSLITFYTELANISDYRDLYTAYLPKSYSDFVDALFRDEQCSFIDDFLKEHSNVTFKVCEEFFYNTSNYGFQAVLTTYIEEIRIMRDLEKYYLQEANKYNYTYNESLIGTEGEDKHYKQYTEEEKKVYDRYRPVLILNEETHKTANIIYRFVVMKVVQSALDNLFDAIHVAFDKTTEISYVINIVFTVLVFIGFFAMWLPFVLGENETIYKTKNMLSIIPREVLFTLPHINIMLGIDDDGN